MKLHVPTRKMKHQRQRNRFGFDLTHSALSRASDVLNIELSEQCDPLDEYFRGYDIHATSVASANNFPVGYWIRQGKVKEVITKLKDTYPNLTDADLVKVDSTRGTSFHSTLAAVFLETIPVEPHFEDTLRALQKRNAENVYLFQQQSQEDTATQLDQAAQDRKDEKILSFEMRHFRSQEVMQEVEAKMEDLGDLPIRSLGKELRVGADNFIHWCNDKGFIKLDIKTLNDGAITETWKPSEEMLDQGFMKLITSVQGNPVSIPWVTRSGQQFLFSELCDDGEYERLFDI